jgi:hypothetical protein
MHIGRDRLRLSGDDASVALGDDMTQSLDHRHTARLYEERGGLWNPANAVKLAGPREPAQPIRQLRIDRAIDDPAGNRKGNYRTATGGALD